MRAETAPLVIVIGVVLIIAQITVFGTGLIVRVEYLEMIVHESHNPCEEFFDTDILRRRDCFACPSISSTPVAPPIFCLLVQ